MRVTHNISTNMYLRNSRRMETSRLKSMTRIMTQRRFNRVSEDVVNGVKALSIRRNLRNVDIYRDNLSASKELFASAEDALLTMSDKIYIQMEAKLVAASNGTYEQMDLDIFAQEFEQMAESMVKTLNADFAERQIFGGTSNGVAPFSIGQAIVKDPQGKIVYPPNWQDYYEDDGNGGILLDGNDEVVLKDGVTMNDIPKSVLYNGVPLNFDVLSNPGFGEGTYTISTLGLNDEGRKEFTDSSFELTEEALNSARNKKDNSLIFPGSKPIYVDIGIGIKYSDDGIVDPQTALDISLNGAAITGNGMELGDDGVWYSKNLIQLALDTAYNLTRGTNIEMEMDLDLANEAIRDLENALSGGNELSAEAQVAIEKKLIESKTGAVLTTDDYGNHVIKLGKKEIYNSSIGNVPTLTKGESTDEGNVVLNYEDENGEVQQLTLNKYIGDQGFVNAVIDKANIANSHILKQITTIGIRQNTIDFYLDRMDITEYNLKERQNLVEGTDMEDEIMNLENLEAAFEAALKLGSSVLPHSIFDYI